MARFLNDDERKWAVERLRSNNTGTETSQFSFPFFGPSSYMYDMRVGLMLMNRGSQVEPSLGAGVVA